MGLRCASHAGCTYGTRSLPHTARPRHATAAASARVALPARVPSAHGASRRHSMIVSGAQEPGAKARSSAKPPARVTVGDAPEGGASVLRATTRIARPPQEVFQYIATPSRWLEWIPSSALLSKSFEGSALALGAQLACGDTVTEYFGPLGVQADAVQWSVAASEAPVMLRLQAPAVRSGLLQGLALTFVLQPCEDAGGPCTEVALSYQWTLGGGSAAAAAVDRLLLRPLQVLQFQQAFANLRLVLQSDASSSPSE